MNDINYEERINEMASFYKNMLDQYNQTENEFIKQHIKTMLSYSWNCLYDISEIKVSKKAEEKRKELKLNVPMKEQRYNAFNKIKKNGGLKTLKHVFHWEHAFTRSMFLDALFDLPEGYSEDDLIALVKKHQIVWITKEEDKVLNKKKYRSKRDAGWEHAYLDCDIDLEDE